MPVQDCENGGKRFGTQGKCYHGPDAARKAYAQGMAMGEVSKAEFEWAFDGAKAEDYELIFKDWAAFDAERGYNPRQPAMAAPPAQMARGGYAAGEAGAGGGGGGGMLQTVSNFLQQAGHAISQSGHQGFRLSGGGGGGGSLGLKSGKGGKGGGKKGGGKKGGRGKAPKAAKIPKGPKAPSLKSNVKNPGVVNGINMKGINFSSLRGMTVGQASTAVAQKLGLDPNSDASEPALVAVLRAYGIDETKFPQLGPSGPQMVLKEEPMPENDGPGSVRVDYNGPSKKIAIAAAHNTLHAAGIDSEMHQGIISGPHLHVGPQSGQPAPVRTDAVEQQLAEDLANGVAPATALAKALAAAGYISNAQNLTDEVPQEMIDGFQQALDSGTDPKQLASSIMAYFANQQQGAISPERMAKAEEVAKAGNLDALSNYWQDKFGEGHEGDFDDCVDTLSGKEGIDDPQALCAWWHKQATGYSPGHAPAEKSEGPWSAIKEALQSAITVLKQEPAASDVHVNTPMGAINPGKMVKTHTFEAGSDGKCKICGQAKGASVHKSEQVEKAEFEINTVVWLDKAEQEKGLVYGVALTPGIKDSQNDIVTKDEIEQAAHRFLTDYRRAGIQHMTGPLPTIEVVESFVAPQDLLYEGSDNKQRKVLKGAWVMGYKINDPAIRDRIKKGMVNPDDPAALTGLSIQGSGVRKAI